MQAPARLFLAGSLSFGPLFAACSGAAGAEVVIVAPAPAAIQEIEPNDDAWNAQPIGSLHAGEFLAIEGHVTECCPDPYDGFAFYAAEPLEARIALYSMDPWADLDFCIWDPFEERFIACFESAFDPELGTFAIGAPGEFHIVVASWAGDAHYRLEVETWPLEHALTYSPNAPSEVGQHFAGYGVRSIERQLNEAIDWLLGLPRDRAAEADRTAPNSARVGQTSRSTSPADSG